MINILLVDDEPLILDVLNKIIQRYFNENSFEKYSIDMANNGFEALGMMEKTKYNMLFLDFMMPKCDGLEVLDTTRITNKEKHQPYICMITAMGLNSNKKIFKEKKATSYVFKPFEIKTINLMLDRYIKSIIDNDMQETNSDDFDDFFDFDEFDELEDKLEDEEKENMELFNKSHSKINAIEFLKDYDDLDYILEDIDEIDELLEEIVEFLDIDSFEKYKNEISNVFNLYATFLNSLSNFDQLATSLTYTKNIILDLDLTSVDNKKRSFVIEIIRAILNDISDWKEYVFVKKDAVDVFYINASAYNSCIQLKNLIQN
jgi:CheY-like chemotaxis protein